MMSLKIYSFDHITCTAEAGASTALLGSDSAINSSSSPTSVAASLLLPGVLASMNLDYPIILYITDLMTVSPYYCGTKVTILPRTRDLILQHPKTNKLPSHSIVRQCLQHWDEGVPCKQDGNSCSIPVPDLQRRSWEEMILLLLLLLGSMQLMLLTLSLGCCSTPFTN